MRAPRRRRWRQLQNVPIATHGAPGFRPTATACKPNAPPKPRSPPFPCTPRRTLVEIRTTLPKDAIVTLDTGNTCLQAADRLAHYALLSLITPLDFGLAAAIGTKSAAPDRPVNAIMGDGAIGETIIEFQTAISHRLPIVMIVLDKQAWGAEKAHRQELYGGHLLGTEMTSPLFDLFAESCGGNGI